MSNVSLIYGNPLNHLKKKFKDLELNIPIRKIETLCILPGFIVMNNLRRKLSLSVRDFSNRVGLTTVENIARRIVELNLEQPPIVISDSVRKQLIIDIFNRIKEDEINTSKDLKERILGIDIEDTDILTTIDQELGDYYRSCDSGREKVFLDEITELIESPFWKHLSKEILEIFDFIHNELLKEMEIAGKNTFLSRSHLVSEANQYLKIGKKNWMEFYPELKEICIMGITVFDSPTLHLLSSISERYQNLKICIYVGKGTKDQLSRRLEKTKVPYNFIDEYKDIKTERTIFKNLFEFERSQIGEEKEKIYYLSAPSPKKEIEEISIILRRLILIKQVKTKDIVLVARNIGKYKTYIENVFETAGIPYSIETRNPMAYSTVYRFLKATTDLLLRIEEDMDIKYHHLMDPLRLGFCLPKRNTRTQYPVNDKTFLTLEESLDFLEQKHYSFNPSSRGLTLDEWKKEFSDLFPWMKEIVQEYVEWLESKTNMENKSAENYSSILSSLTYYYIKNTRKVIFNSTSGPGIDNNRYQFFKYHPTNEANRIRDRIPTIKSHLEYMDLRNEDEDIKWKDVSEALGELIGGETFGTINLDQNAVVCIDAANILFREHKFVFVLGLHTDEFPRKCPSSIFLQNEIKKEFELKKTELADKDENFAFLYNLTPENDYASELDFFESVLLSATDTIYLSRVYLDREGRRREWSSFLDGIENITQKERKIFPSEIFSFLSDEVDDIEDLKLLSDKEILKLYNWISNRENNDLFPKISMNFFTDVYRIHNLKIQKEEIEDRVKRYLYPPKTIKVNIDDIYLNKEFYTKMFDSPFRIHEISLAHECPLRYYFYQFYFNWFNGNEIEREIPLYSIRRLHYRYGYYPKKLRKLFLRKTEEDLIYEIYDENNIKREKIEQKDVTEILLDFFDKNVDFYISKYENIIETEKVILQNEKRYQVNRKWTKVEELILDFEDDISIILPKHRLDEITITKENGTKSKFFIPVLHTNTSFSLYEGFEGPRFEDFNKNSIYDLRLPLMHNYYEERLKKAFFGTEFIEPFTGKRRGIFKQYINTKYLYYNISQIYPKDVNERSVLIPIPMLKKTYVAKLRNTLEKTLNILKDARNGLFDSAKRANEECRDCDYWRLCRGYANEQIVQEEN